MIQLVSRWGKDLDVDHILPEYPRPSLVRDSYLNLNGEWEYCINESPQTESYDGKILVPFSPETLLSGVGRVLMPHQYLHYRTHFTLPSGFKKSRVILHFGAVDQECRAFLNGALLGEHKGGYLPFSFDITAHLAQGENELTLQVIDWTEKLPHGRGKQKIEKRGKYASLFYTPQSGIWKTVWLESVEEDYIKGLKITPMYDESAVYISIQAAQGGETAHITVMDGDLEVACGEIEVVCGEMEAACGETEAACGEAEAACGETETACGETETVRGENHGGGGREGAGAVCGAARGKTVIKLDGFKPWSPDSPHLYDVKIVMGKDEVRSYFGMRKVSVGRDSQGILRFYVNNRPCFFNGLLDQGYWPESLLTAPSDEALVYDILKMKEMGYNTIRKHVKIEPERFFYHCDRLGMFVWQDMPNGGGDYNMVFVTHLPNAFDWFARGIKDSHYGIFRRKDQEGREQYYRDLRDMIDHLRHFPSIVVWVPFNEGWGQFDAAKATEIIREMDPGRVVNEACGWFDQHGGDMYSIHNYIHKLKVKPQKDRVVALTEYGGYAYPVKGHTACEKEFGYQHYHSSEELTANYRRLWEEEIFPNLERGLSSAIYTQTSDIEEEINGLMTYDREVDKMVVEEVQEINRKLYERFEEMTSHT